jgi:VWFA-related protein
MMRLLLALPLAIALGAAPQFRASVDVVRIEALVLDDGRPVAGLTAADFAVTDNGAPQTIAVRPLARQPLDVAITLDTSSSVRGKRLDQLREAARSLIAQLGPDDRATLVTFNHALTLGPRDAAPATLASHLAGLEGRGRTSLIDAVTTALAWNSDRRRPNFVLVFSDGLDISSWTRVDQALALAGASDAVVDTVLTGELLPTSLARLDAGNMVASSTPGERFLIDLAEQTGGRVHNGDSGAGLSGAFKLAFEHFRARYEITYTATSTAPGWHALQVSVPARRGATVHARRGYQR